MSQVPPRHWLLLLPQVPPHPSSLRVRVWRRLGQLGAVAVKNAAYLLPDTEEALEDFTWLRQEILDAGGGALLLRAHGLGTADAEVEELFRTERDGDYQKLADEVAVLARTLTVADGVEPAGRLEAERALRKLQERMEAIRRLDFFGAEQGPVVEAALRAAAERLAVQSQPVSGNRSESSTRMPARQLWVTRAGVYVDRLACAWAIRRDQ